MSNEEALFRFALRMGDNSLVLGHRLSEWCGHAPQLEEDIALTNIALDLIGQARNYLTLAGELEGKGRSEDDLAYLRPHGEYTNVQLVELPKGDFGFTIARNFLYDAFHLPLLKELVKCSHAGLRGVAEKSVKEVEYHLRHSSGWMARLGDGTDESHRRTQRAVDELWPYTGELFAADEAEEALAKAGIIPDLGAIRKTWSAAVDEVFSEATLKRPQDGTMATGGKQGDHTEHLAAMLDEMQSLVREHPGAKW